MRGSFTYIFNGVAFDTFERLFEINLYFAPIT